MREMQSIRITGSPGNHRASGRFQFRSGRSVAVNSPARDRITAQKLAEAGSNKRLVVFDYDGTLASLGVDWDAVRASMSGVGREFGFESSFRPLWSEVARARDVSGEPALARLFEALAVHERVAVATQQPRADIVDQARRFLEDGKGPECAVFSVNLHQTVITGLEALRLGSIRRIVGADDVTRWKPDPEGLNVLIHTAGSTAEDTLFIGDSRGDEEAATSVGVDFLWA